MWVRWQLSCWWWNYVLKMYVCVYIYILCVFAQNWWNVMCCWWIVGEFMINCCCCYEILLLMIDVMGSHNHRAWCEFVLFSWEFLWKMGQMVIFVEMIFWFKFYMDLNPSLCLETFRQTLGSNLGIGKSKLGFWSGKWVFPERYLS